MTRFQSLRRVLFLALLATVAIHADTARAADLEMMHAVYRPDIHYPQYLDMWQEGWKWMDETGEQVRLAHEDMKLGGYLFAYVRNTGDGPMNIQDVHLDGISLKDAIYPYKGEGGMDRHPSSLLFSKLPQEQLDRLTAAGEPLWYKATPFTVPAGTIAEIVIRLRHDPQADTARIEVVSDKGTATVATPTRKAQPRIASVGVLPALDKVYLYLRHPSGRGVAPRKVFLDGQDVTDRSAIQADTAQATVPVVIDLAEPLKNVSYHCFHVEYPDGSKAFAGLTVWGREFVYGMWGSGGHGNSNEEKAADYLHILHDHNFNGLMSHFGRQITDFVRGPKGAAMCRKLDIGVMCYGYGDNGNPPLCYYIQDEPDAMDFSYKMIEDPGRRLGASAQSLVNRMKIFHDNDPDTMRLVNTDNTYKPFNWYTYAQLPDLPSADPYYLPQMKAAYYHHPNYLGAFTKPTYVYAVSEIYNTACAPKPMHTILHSCRLNVEPGFRGPTPEEKRVEVYYALAGGTKGISYWWFTPKARYGGCGDDTPEMKALLKELALLGAEARTAAPLLSRACPIELDSTSSRQLWVRGLAAGQDSLVLFAVNDNIASDRAGTIYKPVERAHVEATLPAWLKATSTFEITAQGTRDVKWKADGSQVALDLDTVELTRMIVVTSDAGLRQRIQERYDRLFADNVKKLSTP